MLIMYYYAFINANLPKLTHFYTGWKNFFTIILGVTGMLTYVDKVLKDIRALLDFELF